MARIHLENLQITLRGYPPETAQQLATELPSAIAKVIDHRPDDRSGEANPDTAPQGLAGDVARQLVRALSERGE